jgi:translation elongation factor Ts
MADCKNALVEADGDPEKAVEIILKKGLAKSAKRAGAVASEGEVRAYVAADAKSGVLVEVNIQTDFAARNDKFKTFVGDCIKVAAGAKEGAKLEDMPYPGASKTVGEVMNELIAQIGEKISIRRFARLDLSAPAGAIHSYVHLGGKIGVLLETAANSADTANRPEFKKFIDDAAMQVAAMNPLYLTRNEVPKTAIDKQREIYAAQLREEAKPKPEAAWPKASSTSGTPRFACSIRSRSSCPARASTRCGRKSAKRRAETSSSNASCVSSAARGSRKVPRISRRKWRRWPAAERWTWQRARRGKSSVPSPSISTRSRFITRSTDSMVRVTRRTTPFSTSP